MVKWNKENFIKTVKTNCFGHTTNVIVDLVNFSEDTADMTVSDMHEKLADLSKKYFQTQNPQVREQIQTFIEFYKQEVRIKEEKQKQEEQNGDLDLDNLIKVS